MAHNKHGHIKTTFPASKMIPMAEMAAVHSQGARKVVKKEHNKKSRQYAKNQLHSLMALEE